MYYLDLSGKVAVVTGGGRGFGAAIVEKLTACGAQVVIIDILNRKDIETNTKKAIELGLKPYYISCDISSKENCENAVQEVIDQFQRVDILVNNASIANGEWDKFFKINILAQYYLQMAVQEDMKKRGWGKIVNITTSGTFSGGGTNVKYNATKGAADSMTRFQAKQFAKDGINVNAVAPGPVLTQIMREYHGEDEFAEHYMPQMPLKRLLIEEDIAKVVLFLCSELSDALCGETILADGGRVRLNP